MMERSTSKITLAESVYERIRRDIITNPVSYTHLDPSLSIQIGPGSPSFPLAGPPKGRKCALGRTALIILAIIVGGRQKSNRRQATPRFFPAPSV